MLVFIGKHLLTGDRSLGVLGLKIFLRNLFLRPAFPVEDPDGLLSDSLFGRHVGIDNETHDLIPVHPSVDREDTNFLIARCVLWEMNLPLIDGFPSPSAKTLRNRAL